MTKILKCIFPGLHTATAANESVSAQVHWIQAPRILNCVLTKRTSTIIRYISVRFWLENYLHISQQIFNQALL